jgi:hypothetical protein
MRTHSVEVQRRQRTKRKGFFTRLLEALHRSRRREAIRVLRRYRHLIAGQAQVRPAKPAPISRQTENSGRNARENNALVSAIRQARQNAGNKFA